MSIRKVQTERIIADVARNYYAMGVAPTLTNVLSRVGEYFSQFPPGEPLSIPEDVTGKAQQSDPLVFNQALARLIFNLDVLYEASLDHVDELVDLISTLTMQLDKLNKKRDRIISQINDYVLSLYNTSSYFFSITDQFSDITQTDITFTSAHVDTDLGSVILPTLSSLTKRVDTTLIQDPSVSVKINNQDIGYYNTISPFSNALDGLDGTAWQIEIDAQTPSEVIAVIVIPLGSDSLAGIPSGLASAFQSISSPVSVSRIDFDPYGITEVQAIVEVLGPNATEWESFSNQIQTSNSKMSFSDNSTLVTNIRITLRKTKPDYIKQVSGSSTYSYFFGAKEIVITQQVYDNQGSFISKPLSMPPDLSHEFVIDAVSLVVDSDIPNDASISYYIAESIGSEQSIGDFDWRQIDPIGTLQSHATVVNFNGAENLAHNIRRHPSGSDLQLIAFDNTNTNLALRNPSPVIVAATDIYRIASFTDTNVPTQSLKLSEGINTTRIYYTPLIIEPRNSNLVIPANSVNDLSIWASIINSHTPAPTVTYGRIDLDNSFFYGGDIGLPYQSVYVETYLDSLSDQELFLADFIKSDPNSLSWDVSVFLNGTMLGNIPPGTVKLTLPWTFKQGLNHVATSINIPLATDAMPAPYLGAIRLFGSNNLYDYGQVKLADWNYVSFFEMQYNQIGSPNSFTIYNNEIISRKQPTDNFHLFYSKPTDTGPAAVRVRADLGRKVNNINVTPKLNSYTLRFSYGNPNT